MIDCRAPKTKQELEDYYQLRWQVLRAPWRQAKGSEQDALEKQGIHRAIYDENQLLLAVGRLHFVDQFTAQIRYMAVAEQAKGRGLGGRLLAALEHEAWLRGAREIQLHARENAVGFYKANGYQQREQSHVLYDQILHYRMTKAAPVLEAHYKHLAEALTQTWHDTIPLSAAMQLNISYFDGHQLVTQCDPDFNKNLHNTMFAGSIYTLATLTGWGWVYLQLANDNVQGDIVLADANIKYLAPVEGVAHGRVELSQVEGDSLALQQNKKSRFTVNVEVLSGDMVAAKFTGKYVVIPKKGDKHA